MGIKYFCDICGKEAERKDLHILRIEKEESYSCNSSKQEYIFSPVISPKEICVFCQEVIIGFLNKMERERK